MSADMGIYTERQVYIKIETVYNRPRYDIEKFKTNLGTAAMPDSPSKPLSLGFSQRSLENISVTADFWGKKRQFRRAAGACVLECQVLLERHGAYVFGDSGVTHAKSLHYLRKRPRRFSYRATISEAHTSACNATMLSSLPQESAAPKMSGDWGRGFRLRRLLAGKRLACS